MLHLNGKPSTGLMFLLSWPPSGVNMSEGQLRLVTPKEGRELVARRDFGRAFAVEVTVEMGRPTCDDATIGIKVQMSPGRTYYYFGLGHYGAGNRVKFWKVARGAYTKWGTPLWPWQSDRPYRLRLEVKNGRVAGYVDGKLVAQHTDPASLAPGPLVLTAHHCEARFDDLRVTSLSDGAILAEDGLDRPDPKLWLWAVPGEERVRAFAAAGVHLYSFSAGAHWRGVGEYDYTVLDERVRRTVRANPEAQVMLRVYLDAPSSWLKVHPDQACRAACHPRMDSDRTVTTGYASFSSELWRTAAAEALRDLVRHVERSEYADHVFAYHLAAGGGQEWFWDTDYGAANVRAFRQWLRTRYADGVEQLRRAWGDPRATFANAAVPRCGRRISGDHFEFFDPAKGRQVSDYGAFHSQAASEAVCRLAGIAKSESGRRKLVAALYGYTIFGNESLGYFECGHHGVARVLACPDVDIVGAPHNYQERQPGGCSVQRVPTGSVRLHGKLYYNEDDTRTALSKPRAGYGRCATVADTVSVLKRNFASVTSAGGSLWWMDQGAGWFHHPEILAAIGGMQRTAEHLLTGDRSSAAEIAVIVSATASRHIRRHWSLIDPLVADQMLNGMTRIGAPVDTYLASDLGRLPRYKLYVMLNAFDLTAEQRQQIKRLRSDGRTILWVYAPGYVTEAGLSIQAVSDLTGFRLRVVCEWVRPRLSLANTSHPIARGCPTSLHFGPWRPIGPIFLAADPEAVVVGRLTGVRGLSHYEIDGGPGLVVRHFGTWRSVWCGVPNLPSPLLRGIARWAGVHIYSDQDDCVYATSRLLCVHARHGGQRHIRLPQPLEVTDAITGETVSRGVRTFSVDLSPHETGLWTLATP